MNKPWTFPKLFLQVVALQLGFICASPAYADLEIARDLMEAGKFEEARALLWPAARSGNAEAEELIGVMYAMGLGVEQDYARAFDWYKLNNDICNCATNLFHLLIEVLFLPRQKFFLMI